MHDYLVGLMRKILRKPSLSEEGCILRMDWTQTNMELARRAGVSKERIAFLRHEVRRSGWVIARSPYQKGLTAEIVMAAGLGIKRDADVARALGVSRQTVLVWRRKLGFLRPR